MISNVPWNITAREMFIGKPHRPQNKTFIRGAIPDIPHEL